MEPLITQHFNEIARLCRQYRVQRLELFGSAAKGNLKQQSDIDFLVEFAPIPLGERADAYFGLLEALESLLKRSVDLVMINAIRNRYFLEAIDKSRTPLYAA